MLLKSPRSKKTKPSYQTPLAVEIPDLAGTEAGAAVYGERLGGDFYDFAPVGERLLFLLLDVSGAKDRAQDIAAKVQNRFRDRSRDLFVSDSLNEADAMVELTLELNRTILESAGGVCHSTAFLGCYSPEVGTLCYVNAGHVPGLIRDGNIAELPATGIPLGLFSHATHDAPTCALGAGAVFLAVSRGVTEGKRKKLEFGIEGVRRTLEMGTALNAQQLCVAVIDAVEEFMQKPPLHNDLTALALSRL